MLVALLLAPAAQADSPQGRDQNRQKQTAVRQPANPGSTGTAFDDPAGVPPDVVTTAPATPVEQGVLPPLEAAGSAIDPAPAGPLLDAGGYDTGMLQQPAMDRAKTRGATMHPQGLPGPVWQSILPADAETLVPHVPLARSPAMASLFQRLLLAPDAQPQLTALRLEALYRAGLLEDAGDLAARLPGDSEPRLMLAGARADLARGAAEPACGAAKSVLPRGAELARPLRQEALLMVAFCAARNRDAEAAGLAVDLLRDQGIEAPVALGVLDSIAESKTPKVPRPDRPQLMDQLFLGLIGKSAAADDLAAAEPALLRLLVASESVPAVVRAAAAERAAAYAALPPGELARRYGAVEFETGLVRNPLASGLEGAEWRALLFQAIAAQPDPQQQARYAKALVDSAREDGLMFAVAPALAEAIGGMPQVPDLAWFAETAIEINLAAGSFGPAVSWTLFADRAAGGGMKGWLALVDIGDPDAHVARGASLGPLTELAASGTLAPEQLHRLAAVLDALAYNVPIPLWDMASRTPQPQTGHLPPTGLLPDLQTAARDRQTGRVVLLALLALGPDGPEGTHLIALGDAIRALKAVGLEADARRIGFEALFAAWPRRAGT